MKLHQNLELTTGADDLRLWLLPSANKHMYMITVQKKQ